jgi:glycosyltransferase involved in cell wall biosynthesis
VLVAPAHDPITRYIARWTLRRADAITSNNAAMADSIVRLGAPAERVHVVTLGADTYFAEAWAQSVNVRGRDTGGSVILSTRAHEPLYNISDIIDAYDLVRRERQDVKMIVAHAGSMTEALRARAAQLGGSFEFAGTVSQNRLRELMRDAEVFVSVPSSDGTSVALLQAMAAGAFPIVSDLATQREWIDEGINGRRVPVHDVAGLARAIVTALDDADLRRRAAESNRAIIADRGTNETQVLKLESVYRAVAQRSKRNS